MEILTEGHKYVAQNFENKETGQIIQFIEKAPKEAGSTELITLNDGTTTEEVLLVLIDRTKNLQAKFPCKENACAITHMEEAFNWFEARTRDRMKRKVEGSNNK